MIAVLFYCFCLSLHASASYVQRHIGAGSVMSNDDTCEAAKNSCGEQTQAVWLEEHTHVPLLSDTHLLLHLETAIHKDPDHTLSVSCV